MATEDVSQRLSSLQDEEAAILRELRAMDSAATGEASAASGPVGAHPLPPPPLPPAAATPAAPSSSRRGGGGGAAAAGRADPADPLVALNALLGECEKEVRTAKGYVAAGVEPIKIVRVPRGATPPKRATFLSVRFQEKGESGGGW